MLGTNKPKFQYGALKVKKIYKGTTQVYSSGNVVTYNFNGRNYTQEYDEGADVLHPTVVTPSKPNWTFKGWSKTAGGAVLTSLQMGSDPITLYAVFAFNSFYAVSSGVLQSGTSGSRISSYMFSGYNTPISADGWNYYGYYGQNQESNGNSRVGATVSFPTKGASKIDITIKFYQGTGNPTIYGNLSVTGYSTEWNGAGLGMGLHTKSFTNIDVSKYSSVSVSVSGTSYGSNHGIGIGIVSIYCHD